MLIYAALGVLIILIIVVLGILAWYFFFRSSPQQPAISEAKTQPILQRFVSNDLKKRAFIVELNEGGYKVVFQVYSEEAVTRGGEIAGWRALHDKPVAESLVGAEEIARGWVHSRN
ncbi:MAG: hypothetical protein PVJ21_22955 [Anaerolineales bacterium]|jgi:hypothetical protein